MENQILVGIFRTLVGTLNLQSPHRDFALMMLGAALADAKVPAGGLLALYLAAKDAQPGITDQELGELFIEHVKSLLDSGAEVAPLVEDIKRVHSEMVKLEAPVAEVIA
jgi:hypothetical protein